MSKIFLLVVCLTVVFSLCACSAKPLSLTGNTDDIANDSSASEVEKTEAVCQHTFKEEVQKEAGYGVNGYKVKFCTKCHETEYIKIPALQSIFELTVKNKSVDMQNNTGFVSFEIEIKNISDKKITSISGQLSVMPPNCILALSCDFDEISLEPYSTIILDSYGYEFEYDSANDTVEKKVYEANFENIKFHFEPTNVVVAE